MKSYRNKKPQKNSRKDDLHQYPNNANHWYFCNGEKMIEVKLKKE